MTEPLLTKRLHISGLTPSITPADLERRLSSFGKVKAMDGFGAPDGLGDPRKFGFVTMEISAKGLAKCLNVLSGSTWKGAKLRIGEAKPDFRERIVQINSNSKPSLPVRPKRTNARNYGHCSTSLPLIPLSATTAASTPGWIVTPSGRVVRPMRMRPERPLEPGRSELGIFNAQFLNGKAKKRVKLPPVRARRRLIDPTKWDSEYLKGVFLNVSVSLPAPENANYLRNPVKYDTIDEKDSEEEAEEDGVDSDTFSSTVRKNAELPRHALETTPNLRLTQSTQKTCDTTVMTSSGPREATEPSDVHDEANVALTMLGSMFGDKEDWCGKESVDGMESLEDEGTREKEIQIDNDVETVLRDVGEHDGSKVSRKNKGKGKAESFADARSSLGISVDLGAVRDTDVEMRISIETSAQTTESAPQADLKALFAPKGEASFSLLNHLDLDLDLDTDLLGISVPSCAPKKNTLLSEPIPPALHVAPATRSMTKAPFRVTFDASRPLLFPPPDLLPHLHPPSFDPTTTIHHHGAQSCSLFPMTARVWGSRRLSPSIAFSRSPQDTPESIREGWEKDKLSLTREWKKTWREARGSRRSEKGEVGGGY